MLLIYSGYLFTPVTSISTSVQTLSVSMRLADKDLSVLPFRNGLPQN